MTIPLKATYKFIATLIKILLALSREFGQIILKFIWKQKSPE